MTVSQHVIRLWNPLPWEDFEAKSLVKFEEALATYKNYMNYMNYKNAQTGNNYDENSGKDVRCCALGIMLVYQDEII